MSDARAQQSTDTPAPPRTTLVRRRDFPALLDRRFLAMLPLVVLALSLPFWARSLHLSWQALADVPLARLHVRLVLGFALLGFFPAFFALVRIGVASITVQQHRALLRIHPILYSSWMFALVLDGFFLVAWPEKVALPNFPLDLGISLVAAAAVPLLWGFQFWCYGLDSAPLLRARAVLSETDLDASVTRPLDTLDYRLLQLIASTGGDPLAVMINDMGIDRRDLMLRLAKLTALRYVDLSDEMHGQKVVLTTAATDALALPVALFAWNTDDGELLRELAAARLALADRQPQKVVVACARSCERMLRGLMLRKLPDVKQVGGKDIVKATLGELVSVCRQHHLVGKFEDNVLSAVNERRKKIHALEGESPIDDQDAFFVYTLTEIAARALVARVATS